MKREAWMAVVCPMVLLAAIFSGAAHAAGDKTLSYGVGLRAGGGYTAYGSSTGTTGNQPNSVGITTLDVRPYISGQVLPFLKFEGNLDLNNSDMGRIHVIMENLLTVPGRKDPGPWVGCENHREPHGMAGNSMVR